MHATAHTSALIGLRPTPVRVEADSSVGVASFNIVGLAETSARESRVRVRSALEQSGLPLAGQALVVALAPADTKTSGGAFDLAIAVAVLAALSDVPTASLESTLLLGELSLTGAIRPVRGVLPQLMGARDRGLRCAIVPRDNGVEAGAVQGLEVLTAETLDDVRRHLSGHDPLPRAQAGDYEPALGGYADLSDVKGLYGARRALEVAAAGAHHMIMIATRASARTRSMPAPTTSS